jgi:hypothetical protein
LAAQHSAYKTNACVLKAFPRWHVHVLRLFAEVIILYGIEGDGKGKSLAAHVHLRQW